VSPDLHIIKKNITGYLQVTEWKERADHQTKRAQVFREERDELVRQLLARDKAETGVSKDGQIALLQKQLTEYTERMHWYDDKMAEYDDEMEDMKRVADRELAETKRVAEDEMARIKRCAEEELDQDNSTNARVMAEALRRKDMRMRDLRLAHKKEMVKCGANMPKKKGRKEVVILFMVTMKDTGLRYVKVIRAQHDNAVRAERIWRREMRGLGAICSLQGTRENPNSVQNWLDVRDAMAAEKVIVRVNVRLRSSTMMAYLVNDVLRLKMCLERQNAGRPLDVPAGQRLINDMFACPAP
jgi:hypothetical protein